jgi:hypothetical protein
MGCADGSRGDGSDLVTTGLAGVLSLGCVFDLRDFTSGDGTEDDSELSLPPEEPRLFLLNSGMGRPIREANSPITLSLTTSMRSMFGLEVPDLRPIKGLDGIILRILL